jgi:hypothetical protein
MEYEQRGLFLVFGWAQCHFGHQIYGKLNKTPFRFRVGNEDVTYS